MATPNVAEKTKPDADESPGLDPAELKHLLGEAKKKAVNFAFALDAANKPVLLLDRRRQPRALERELKGTPGVKNPRGGTVAVPADEPTLVRFTFAKSATGMARRLVTALKGTGYSKVEVASEDGAPPERHEEADETGAHGTAGEVVAKPASKRGDTAKLVAELTPLVREALELASKNPAQKATLQKLATTAQTSLRKAMLSLDQKDIDQTRDDIDALHDGIEDAGDAEAKPQAKAQQPGAQQVTDRLTDLVRQAGPAMKAAPDRAAAIKAALTDAQAALKTGNAAKASQLADQLEGLLKPVSGPAASPIGQSAGEAAGALAGAAGPPPDPQKRASLASAAKSTGTTLGTLRQDIAAVRAAILKEVADELAGNEDAIENELKQLDRVAEAFGSKLADALQRASQAADGAGHAKAVGEAKAEISRLIAFVKSEPLVAHLDANPFGASPQIASKFTAIAKHALELLR